MLATVNGIEVIDGRITMPVRGVWTMNARVKSDQVLSGVVSIVAPDMKLTGKIVRSGVYRGTTSLFAVAGANGLGQEIKPTGFYQSPVSVVLADIARLTGEKFSTTSDPNYTTLTVKQWNRRSDVAGVLLSNLVDYLSSLTDADAVNWRILDDGTIWIGVDKWTASTFQGQEISAPTDPAYLRRTIGSDSAGWRPGTTFNGNKIVMVEHIFTSSNYRTILEYLS